ncbi:MAG TPA: response regulator, partial [Rudaea sp.]|nr:response regulator [Rudaea sp.]
KSEFLANMSHELRTPLNSILILGQQLSENPDRNLSGKQVEYAKTIHGAGTDLLNLISDILDLSKIESGTVTVENEELPFAKLRDTIDRSFRHEAESRKLAFSLDFDPNLGRALNTDPKRLLQVLKNLLSNAFKFTAQGGVRLRVAMAKHGWSVEHSILRQAPAVVELSVSDTGIGIPAEKQKIIFEAFQQADAGTARKYGGTGLGLAISRELAGLLGGEIRLTSVVGQGSTFTLFLPLNYIGQAGSQPQEFRMLGGVPGSQQAEAAPTMEQIADDRQTIVAGDTTLLIVEDDPHYALVLLELARATGFKGLVAARGAEALALAREFLPTAISLDIALPDMLGWTVLSRLKQDPATRHIPVQIVTVEEEHHQGLERGAFSYVNKPATTESLEEALERIKQFSMPRTRHLLVIEDNDAERMSICELIAHDDVAITTTRNGAEALAALDKEEFDCAVVDLRLPDTSGLELMHEMQKHPKMRDVPIVVYTGQELSEADETELRKIAKSIVLKDVRSPERLLDETALFLHRVVSALPPHKQQMLERLHQSDEALIGKKVLIIDDDIRNIFALSSLLERHGVNVLTATAGADAIALIDETPDVALALVDIMMPQMDGYQTIRLIRERPAFRLLPMIALTAKAMKGDREKCLEAGASDYIAKPVNSEQLLSLLRIWLHR